MDYYQVLEIDRSASAEDIKKAYRKAALKYHPDRNKNNQKEAEEQFKKISEAYSVLSDPEKKQQYDTFGTVSNSRHGQQAHFDPFDIFASVFGDRDPFGRHHRGGDLKVQIPITLEEVVKGAEKQISYSRSAICSKCKGVGGIGKTCSQCGGYGQVQYRQAFFTTATTCPHCRGKGVNVTNACVECHGNGSISEQRTISVKVPIGVETGQAIRLSGAGNQSQQGMPFGDLICYFVVQPHAFFTREGDDLYCKYLISITQACLGATVNIPTIHGNPVQLKIPPGIQPSQVLRIKGKGVRHGHQLVEINIEIPKDLPEEAKSILSRLDKIIGAKK